MATKRLFYDLVHIELLQLLCKQIHYLGNDTTRYLSLSYRDIVPALNLTFENF